MNGRIYAWAWFALACAALAIGFWATRFEFLDCADVGCYVGDRWTGEVFFQGEEMEPAAPLVVGEPFQ